MLITQRVTDVTVELETPKEQPFYQCGTLSDEQKIISLIKEGSYNVAARIAESKDDAFQDHVYGKISLHAAGKNDIFLVTQFTGSMHDVSQKDKTLESAAKIIAEKGPHWMGASDLKAITQLISGKERQDRVLAECKCLITNRKV